MEIPTAKGTVVNDSNQQTHVILAEGPPVLVSGVAVALGQAVNNPDNKVVTINFFSSYADPRTPDAEADVRQYLAPVMMWPDAAASLARLLAEITEGHVTEEHDEEGGSS